MTKPLTLTSYKRIVILIVTFAIGTIVFLSTKKYLFPPELPLEKFEVSTLESNEAVSLTEYMGKPLIVEIWATWCPPCRKSLPVLKKIKDQYGSAIEIICISDEESGKIVSFLSEHNLDGIIFLKSQKNLSELGIGSIPTSYFYDPSGKCIQKHIGELSEEEIKSFIKVAK